MSGKAVGGLSIDADDPLDRPWANRETKPLIERGLDALESKRGLAALEAYAKKLILDRNAKGSKVAYLTKDAGFYVKTFLDKVRQDFPKVHWSDIEAYGEAHDTGWGHDPFQYRPKAAGSIKLNRTVSGPSVPLSAPVPCSHCAFHLEPFS
jgi:hypothetical protein